MEALEEIGELRDTSAFDKVKDLISHEDPNVRRMAAWALGRMQLPEAIRYLKDGLNDPHIGVNYYSALALGEIDHFQATKALVEGLKHKEWRVRNCCVESLGKHEVNQGLATDALISCLDDNWVQIRQSSAKVLGSIGDPLAIPRLCFCLTDTYVRKYAAEALVQYGEHAIPHLLKIISGPCGDSVDEIETVIWILRALGSIDTKEILPAIGKCLSHKHWRIRREAARVLGTTSHSVTALDYLKEAQQGETDKHVLIAIQDSIRQLNPEL